MNESARAAQTHARGPGSADASRTAPADPDAARTEAVRALEVEFGELANRFRRYLALNAQRLAPGMLPGAYKLFTTIARRGPITPSALAELLIIDRGQVSRAVRELERHGLVQREPDPEDGRSSLLSATPEGLERLAAARAPQEGTLLRALEDWPVHDIQQLARLLHTLLNEL
ncbi:MarR family winged helix-turn-helix transcriptional regulator [Microbacterium sp. No. 7]|uniref:MarR family winged helix-turn-helix transcriptional regulator n=1 Tax=Microbacterium sp. No. 7 TaxID=1714373 RepID=UPI0006ED2CAE|nr:MarR family transcriptional regulator [Microbacterium sp. No. 7]ALJ21300.1 transcriptional regulator [Microbacterium sp. No. 7]